MRTTIALSVLALALAGCGGDGSDEPTAEPTTQAPPRVYTEDELIAALPTMEQVPAGREVNLECPKDGEDKCASYEGGSIVVFINGGTPADTEVGANRGYNFVALTVEIDDDEGLTDRIAKEAADKEVGDYEEPAQELEGGGGIAARSGTRTVDDLEVGPFAGYLEDERFSGDDIGEVQQSFAVVSSGNALIRVQATLGVDGRDDGEAAALAQRLLDEYLERLG